MPREASVYSIFVASPSDVSRERDLLREIFFRWNSLHSRTFGVYLEPIFWETHALRAANDKAQSQINEQLLEDCDFAVGVFWTRIGTPTQNAPGGAVEEVTHFIEQEKPVLLFFSEKPLEMNDVDFDQLKVLKEFKTDMEENGFFCTYRSEAEFSEIAYQQIANLVAKKIAPSAEAGSFLRRSQEDSRYTVETDYDRLEVQADLVRGFDESMIHQAIGANENPSLSVLDIGCGSGYVTHSRFQDPKFGSVLGIDKSVDAIARAQKQYSDDKYSFEVVDVSNPFGFETQFDLVFTALTLHHLGNWEAVLRRAWRRLKPNGAIVIRTPDDGLKLCYPRTEQFQEILDLSRHVTGGSDRVHGRKIFTYARRLDPQPSEVKYHFNPQVVEYGDNSQRGSLFEDNFSYRGDYAFKLHQEDPSNQSKFKFAQDVQQKILKRREDFLHDEQFFVSIDVGVVIKKGPASTEL